MHSGNRTERGLRCPVARRACPVHQQDVQGPHARGDARSDGHLAGHQVHAEPVAGRRPRPSSRNATFVMALPAHRVRDCRVASSLRGSRTAPIGPAHRLPVPAARRGGPEDAGADESAVLSSLVQHRLLDEEMLARALFLGPATAANPGSRPRTLVLGDAAKVVMAPVGLASRRARRRSRPGHTYVPGPGPGVGRRPLRRGRAALLLRDPGTRRGLRTGSGSARRPAPPSCALPPGTDVLTHRGAASAPEPHARRSDRQHGAAPDSRHAQPSERSLHTARISRRPRQRHAELRHASQSNT